MGSGVAGRNFRPFTQKTLRPVIGGIAQVELVTLKMALLHSSAISVVCHAHYQGPDTGITLDAAIIKQ